MLKNITTPNTEQSSIHSTSGDTKQQPGIQISVIRKFLRGPTIFVLAALVGVCLFAVFYSNGEALLAAARTPANQAEAIANAVPVGDVSRMFAMTR